MDAYVADPLCGFGIDRRLGQAACSWARGALADPAAGRGHAARACRSISRSARPDPVNGGLTLLTPLVDRLKEGGPRPTSRWSPTRTRRHEILNETNRDEVIGDLISWLDRVAG